MAMIIDAEDLDTVLAEILDAIEPHRDRLAMPEAPVYEFLVEGETDVTPDDLREGVDYDDPDLADFEAEAFARLLIDLLDDEDG